MNLIAALCLLSPIQDGPSAGESVRRAVDFLKSKQNEDGTFDLKEMQIDMHPTGIYSICALALLSEPGHHEAAAKTIRRVLDNADDEGFFVPRTKGLYGGFHRAFVQHGYATTLVLEAILQHRAGRVKWDGELFARMGAAAEKAVRYIEKHQHENGSWTYDPLQKAQLGKYEETTTSVAAMEALALARRAGFEVDPRTIKRAYVYLDTRVDRKNGGFINGSMERSASPHMTPAAVTVIGLFREGPGAEEMIRIGLERMDREMEKGYLSQWAKGKFPTRRQMYGLYHACLATLRLRGRDAFGKVHAEVVKNLLDQQAEDGKWVSTIGEVGATAFGILTLNMPRKDGLILFTLRSRPWY